MSLLLCRLEPVKHPFVVAELGVRLFSSQELCYVIYENLLLVMEDFVDERLIQFIREDLDMDLIEEGLMDSLAIAELLVAIEDEFGIVLSPTEYEKEDLSTAHKIEEILKKKGVQ